MKPTYHSPKTQNPTATNQNCTRRNRDELDNRGRSAGSNLQELDEERIKINWPYIVDVWLQPSNERIRQNGWRAKIVEFNGSGWITPNHSGLPYSVISRCLKTMVSEGIGKTGLDIGVRLRRDRYANRESQLATFVDAVRTGLGSRGLFEPILEVIKERATLTVDPFTFSKEWHIGGSNIAGGEKTETSTILKAQVPTSVAIPYGLDYSSHQWHVKEKAFGEYINFFFNFIDSRVFNVVVTHLYTQVTQATYLARKDSKRRCGVLVQGNRGTPGNTRPPESEAPQAFMIAVIAAIDSS
ncbi:hypothetical protein FB446DRAFT_707072 [Lentinula raphanica]|nr:hypothetical protein FB446DRAFT_707072 [Lentinula raphanica]